MTLSKSEGVWGNTEAIPRIIRCTSRLLQQPETQPDSDGDQGKTGRVSGASPSQSPSVENKYLISLVNSIISYGSGNRTIQNESVCGSFYQVYPSPPVPSANTGVSSKNIFPNFGDDNA